MRNPPPLIERFYSNIHPEPNSGCWLWVGSIHSPSKPYGRIGNNRKTYAAHRISYELHKGAVRPDLFVCHKCDNPNCVNPDHLFLGTFQDNINDRNAKGRQARGLTHGNSKLTADIISKIRSHPGNNSVAARQLGLLPEQVRRVRLRINWADFSEESTS